MVANTIPIHADSYRTVSKTLDSSHSTRPVVVFKAGADGSRIHAMNAATNDAGTNKLTMYVGQELTKQEDMGTGAFVDGGGGSDTITRSSGSFVTDGWKVGDRMVVTGATTRANDFIATLTAVSATTLTFATATVNTAENLPAGASLFRVGQIQQIATAINSGNSDTVPATDIFNQTNFPSLLADPNVFMTLGAYDCIAIAVTTALSAEFMDITTFAADY